MRVANVMKIGKCIYDETILGLRIYASMECITQIITQIASTIGSPPPSIPYPIMIIGMPDKNVPNTGINPKINTIIESVKMNGKCPAGKSEPISKSPIVVKIELTNAIIPCALKIFPNPETIFSLKY